MFEWGVASRLLYRACVAYILAHSQENLALCEWKIDFLHKLWDSDKR